MNKAMFNQAVTVLESNPISSEWENEINDRVGKLLLDSGFTQEQIDSFEVADEVLEQIYNQANDQIMTEFFEYAECMRRVKARFPNTHTRVQAWEDGNVDFEIDTAYAEEWNRMHNEN